MAETNRENVPLAPRQQRAIELLCEYRTFGEVAAACDVSVRTLRRWRREHPAFVAALRGAQTDALTDLSRQFHTEAAASLDVLVQLRDKSDAPAGVRLRAADLILTHAANLRQAVDLEQRIAALESILKRDGKL